MFETSDELGPLPPAQSADEDRLNRVATGLCLLSPYSYDVARAIVEAIVTRKPLSEIVPLLALSRNDLEDLRSVGLAGAEAGERLKSKLLSVSGTDCGGVAQ